MIFSKHQLIIKTLKECMALQNKELAKSVANDKVDRIGGLTTLQIL
jgi:hypothetical protein